jgi:histone H3/H4
MAEVDGSVWQRCSACKKDIRYHATHWVCSVSTCNRNRTKLVFCSVACWDSHVAILRHRDAWAVEARAPSREAWAAEVAAEEAAGGPTIRQPPVRQVTAAGVGVPPAPPPPSASSTPQPVRPAPPMPSGSEPRRVVATPPPAGAVAMSTEFERDILIVVSKMKKYIKDRSGMNCSDGVADELSNHVRAICDDSIRAAATDGRKTVLDRDVPKARR